MLGACCTSPYAALPPKVPLHTRMMQQNSSTPTAPRQPSLLHTAADVIGIYCVDDIFSLWGFQEALLVPGSLLLTVLIVVRQARKLPTGTTLNSAGAT